MGRIDGDQRQLFGKVDDPIEDVARKIRLVNDDLRPGGFLGISYRRGRDETDEYASLHGGNKPTIFRTLKGAYDNIGLYAREDAEKIIILLDLELLPVVHPDRYIEKRPGFSEAAFSERQMELWTRRTEQLIKGPR